MNKYLLYVILFFIGLSAYQCVRNEDLTKDLDSKSNLIEVLSDSVTYTRNELKQEVASKKAISATVKDLEKSVALLTDNQRKLLQEAKTAGKEVVTVTQVKEVVTVREQPVLLRDSLTGNYSHRDQYLSYTISVEQDSVRLDSLSLYNDKSVVIREEPEKGVRVSVTNTNPYFKTADVDALYIPENRKKSFLDSKGVKVGLFILGLGTGAFIFN
ncbi:hypothetical protein EFA69_06595 [Rufibacter immobilis]|uniref:Uncharacterized protein n=1 Tax=Rufibacter immobilis TaxID=1348778 RepID=A0A3M9N0P1_9BACT|nr:hypothetical protein [Rufibacter immobilis]RNI30955.1 hypothetical protein EFA69_06595 [Rufibacter immobilis]